jgi:hypothetical protein
MRFLAALIALIVLPGCSIVNIFKGPDDFSRNYAAGWIKVGIDKDVEDELIKASPNGYATKPYSLQIWNDYWNGRIYHLFDIGHNGPDKAYKGPSGPEWIRYIIDTRRAKGLPELEIEERNRAIFGDSTK